MATAILMISLIVAGAIVVGAWGVQQAALRVPAGLLAIVVIVGGAMLASVRFVPDSKLGVIIKNALGAKLPPGKIIATAGEMGPQARILPPGWHFGYWPILYDVQNESILEIGEGEVGLLTASGGLPLPSGDAFAPEWAETEIEKMLDAEHFLTVGKGYRGPQATVLTPGKYRINPKLFKVETQKSTNIERASVGVVKSNVGPIPVSKPAATTADMLVDRGQRGIWKQPLSPQKLYLNTSAYEVTMISTRAHIVEYTEARGEGSDREISVRSADGFTFPVDVRVEFEIMPEHAPLVVASLRDDQDGLRTVLNSAVRATFRNSAERVKALDYVRQRSQQERQALEAIKTEMNRYGVTVNAVRIGNIGNEQTLGQLLKTQTDREIAVQEQQTFQEQQRAAEQKKALSRTQQESEEEKRLATANYQVRIAEADKQKKIIEAGAEAEAISIRATAQAKAYSEIAAQIGRGNAALMELMKIVGERNIQITPRVMVNGSAGNGAEPGPAETTALIGTMLDSMMSRGEEPAAAPVPSAKPQAEPARPAPRSP